MRKMRNHQYAPFRAICNFWNNDENYCKKVTNVAKKNGDLITNMRHFEYMNYEDFKDLYSMW